MTRVGGADYKSPFVVTGDGCSTARSRVGEQGQRKLLTSLMNSGVRQTAVMNIWRKDYVVVVVAIEQFSSGHLKNILSWSRKTTYDIIINSQLCICFGQGDNNPLLYF